MTPRRFGRWTALAWIATLLAVAGCGERRQGIVLLVDTVRADRLSCYGYGRETTPRMDALAGGGLRFPDHYSQGSSTRIALPALIYSRYYVKPIFPFNARIPVYGPDDLFLGIDDEARSLPALASSAGLLTAAVSAHPWLHEDTEFAREFDEMYDLTTILESDPRLGYPEAPGVVDFALDWIRAHRDQDFLLYVHLMDAHFPHRFGEDARRFLGEEPTAELLAAFGPDGIPRAPHECSDEERRYLDALYDGSLAFVDRQIGRFADSLASWSLLDDAVLCVTSDHGEGLLTRNGRVQHGGPWYEELARVPLILHAPSRLDPGVFVGFSEGVDVLPTMCALLGVAIPDPVRPDGVNLLEAGRGRRTARSRTALREERYKLHLDDEDVERVHRESAEGTSVRGRLFDLRTDPGESADLWSRNPDVVARLLDTFRAELGPGYRRYRDARATSPPRSPFAIAVQDLAFEGPLREVEEDREPERPGWVRHDEMFTDWLWGRQAEEPLRIEVTVPSGSYDVSLMMRGAVDVRVDGQDRGRREARPATWENRFDADQVPLGRWKVRDDRLRLELSTDAAGAAFILNAIGFLPEEARRDPSLDTEREERLRALGYLD